MRISISFITIVLILFSCNIFNKKQNSINRNRTSVSLNNDSFNSLIEFKILTEKTLSRIKDSNQLIKEEDAVLLSKIYNSINSYMLLGNDSLKSFVTKYEDQYLNKIIKILDCEISFGLGYYSSKHKLIIGGIKYPINSYIFISELEKR